MMYLVTTNHFDASSAPPEQMGALLDTVVSSIEALNGLLSDGRIIAGGVPAGQKKHVFIVEASSNEEVTDLVHGLPFWMAHQWEILPLESWTNHLAFLRSG